MPAKFWRRAWRIRRSISRLSGLTSKRLTADPGVESWIASLAATRASHSASPVADLAKTIQDTFGLQSLESLRKLNPHACFSRTSQGTLALDSTPSVFDWKAWATGLRQDSLARKKRALRIGVTASLSWGSPKVSTNNGIGQRNPTRPSRLEDQACSDWLTPHGMSSHDSIGKEGNGAGEPLTVTAADWYTPDVPNGGRKSGQDLVASKGKTDKGKRQVGLANQAEDWATPKTPTGGKESQDTRGSGGVDLQTMTQFFPIHPHVITVQPSLFTLQEETPMESGETYLREGLGSLRPLPTRKLNPYFAAWLMGQHPGSMSALISLEQWGIPWSLYLLRMHSSLFFLVSNSGDRSR